jgi:3',5'-cyclic AMP phosphodiesterase CpdA
MKRRSLSVMGATALAFALTLTLVLALASCAGVPRLRCEREQALAALLAKAPAYPDARFVVLSDPHHYDGSLGVEGAAFERCLAEDRKLLRESGEILEEALRGIATVQAQFVIVPGDLTKDGERSSHLQVAGYLQRIEESGKRVYVICGNHDVLNPEALRYEGEETERVPNVSPAEFASIYAPFGYSESLRRDPASLSYIAEPVPGLWLLALDSCIYGEAGEKEHRVDAGRFSPATLAWIEDSLIEAARQGKAVAAVMHHGVMEHYRGQQKHYGAYVVEDSAHVSRLLAAYNVRLVFTGHYHAQDITLERWNDGRFLYDVETGSLVTYPCPLRLATLSGNRLSLRSRFVERINSRPEGFGDYAREYLLQGIAGIAVQTMRELHVAQKDADSIAPQIALAFAAHYAGDERPPAEILDTRGVGLMGRIVIWSRRSLVEGLWHDLEPPDNDLLIDLGSGAWQTEP